MTPEERRERRCDEPDPVRAPFSALSSLLEQLARTPDVDLGSNWDAVLRPGAVIGRFQMVREIGRGGFGVAWEARDTHLGRSIAFKALRVFGPAAVREKHLLHEVDVAARLTHPNIVTLHDCGTTEHGPWVVMELLRGETLAARLEKGPLKVGDALHVATEAAKGVAHAHANGVVHRDLQPSNVFLCADGQVKLLDFGLAHAFGTRRVRGGTPNYMAPEQQRGAPEDERTDVFALGVVLFRMLTGELPFDGSSEGEGRPARRARLEGAPTLDALVDSMLQVDPVRRPRDGSVVLQALEAARREIERGTPEPAVQVERTSVSPRRTLPHMRSRGWLVLLLAALALATTAGVLALRARPARQAQSASLPSVKCLVVLPLRDVSPMPGDGALSAGLTEVLTNKLRQIEQFRTSLAVIAANDVVQEGVTSARGARDAFGANLALSGTIHREADRVTVAATLVDAVTSRIIAGRDVQAPHGDTAALQRKLVAMAVELLEVQLQPEAVERLLSEPTRAPGAYEFYLQGRGYLQRYDRLENLDSAALVFDQALSRDPQYGLAHAGKAETYLRRYELTLDRRFLELARASARRAVELSDDMAAVHLTTGLVEVAFGDYAGAIARFERALELEPDNGDARREIGNAYDAAGRTADAEATFRRAIHSRPSSWAAYKDLGVFYNRHGRLTEALPLFQRVVELTPDNYAGYANLGGLYFRLGLHEEAVRNLERSLALRPTWHAWSNLGSVRYYESRYDDAAEAFRKAVELSPIDARLWGHLADADRWAGHVDASRREYRRAIDLLEKQLALTPRDPELWTRTGMHLAALGERERALAHVAKAARLASKDGLVLFRSAVVYEESGLRDRALQALREALALGYSREEIRNAPPLRELRQDPRFAAMITAALSLTPVPAKE